MTRLMAGFGGLTMMIALAACASQKDPDVGGQVFCTSYENKYLGDCRQNCENETTAGDVDGIKQCQEYCDQQLAKDSTFNDECK